MKSAVDGEALEGGGPDGEGGGEQVEPAGRSGEEPLRGAGVEVAVDAGNTGRTWRCGPGVPDVVREFVS